MCIRDSSKGYKVNFYATIDQIHRFNFDLNDTQEELTDEEIVHIKRWMVSLSLIHIFLMPVSCRRQLFDLSDEMATKIDIQFYLDSRDALIKSIIE